MIPAQSQDGFCNGGVCIVGKVDPTGKAGNKGFSELFRAGDHPFSGNASGDFLQSEHSFTNNVHTDYYYNHIFEKVNKN